MHGLQAFFTLLIRSAKFDCHYKCLVEIYTNIHIVNPGLLCVVGAADSGQIKDVDLTAVSRNWNPPLACQSERVIFSSVSMRVCT